MLTKILLNFFCMLGCWSPNHTPLWILLTTFAPDKLFRHSLITKGEKFEKCEFLLKRNSLTNNRDSWFWPKRMCYQDRSLRMTRLNIPCSEWLVDVHCFSAEAVACAWIVRREKDVFNTGYGTAPRTHESVHVWKSLTCERHSLEWPDVYLASPQSELRSWGKWHDVLITRACAVRHAFCCQHRSDFEADP